MLRVDVGADRVALRPTRDELQWASDAPDCDELLLTLMLMLMLKSYQRMGCFPKLEDVPAMVVDFVRRQV
ncbi:hypothetical protein [Streptomyces piniterrae]|uniref:hypothetical protein n=1 Tax=Streptomyces piniterrae TaxID=2571125 RepID=UPI001FEA1461|nr:hypothetical protein [Streptomyces piniterrae]